MSFVNPLLAGVVVSGAIKALSLPEIAPAILGILFVGGLRMLLRQTVARMLKGKSRSPLIRLQHKIGNWLWWIDPILHRWGIAGWLVKRLRLAVSAASFLIYAATDLLVTFLAGAIFYLTRSYALSLLAAVLPALEVAPWFVEKTVRIRRLRKVILHNSK